MCSSCRAEGATLSVQLAKLNSNWNAYAYVSQSVAGMRTGRPLNGQALAQIGGDVGGNISHGVPPSTKASHASAMPVIRWEVACKYQ